MADTLPSSSFAEFFIFYFNVKHRSYSKRTVYMKARGKSNPDLLIELIKGNSYPKPRVNGVFQGHG
jgi:hypothetical protein